jgi:hypothetical protein
MPNYNFPNAKANPTAIANAIAQMTAAQLASVQAALAITPAAAANPVFDPDGGTITAATDIALSTTTSGASIRYTTDGSTPSPTIGTPYSDPFLLAASATVRAIAYKTGWTSSSVISKAFTVS